MRVGEGTLSLKKNVMRYFLTVTPILLFTHTAFLSPCQSNIKKNTAKWGWIPAASYKLQRLVLILTRRLTNNESQ